MGLRALGQGWNSIAVGPTAIVAREERSVKPQCAMPAQDIAMNDPFKKPRTAQQLEILARRSLELADRVAAGELDFLDAVDMA